MLARPGRTVLTILGTVLGVAALVATLGLAKTAGNQIVTRFDALASTSVSVSNRSDGPFSFSARNDISSIPWDAEDRLTRLNGVVAAGTLTLVDTEGELVSSVPINDPLGQSKDAIDVLAASPGLFDAVVADLATGRFFDAGHDLRREPVAVLGPGAAARLNINRVDQQPAIFIGDRTLAVIGIIEDVARESSMLDAIIIPNGAARSLFDTGAPAEVHIRTEIGAAYLIGEQAPIALNPNEPELLRVQVPPEPRAGRRNWHCQRDAGVRARAGWRNRAAASCWRCSPAHRIAISRRVSRDGLHRRDHWGFGRCSRDCGGVGQQAVDTGLGCPGAAARPIRRSDRRSRRRPVSIVAGQHPGTSRCAAWRHLTG